MRSDSGRDHTVGPVRRCFEEAYLLQGSGKALQFSATLLESRQQNGKSAYLIGAAANAINSGSGGGDSYSARLGFLVWLRTRQEGDDESATGQRCDPRSRQADTRARARPMPRCFSKGESIEGRPTISRAATPGGEGARPPLEFIERDN